MKRSRSVWKNRRSREKVTQRTTRCGNRLRQRLSVEALEERQVLSFTNPFELSSLLAENGGDGSVGFVLNGINEDDWSGFPVSEAGDINGDGVDDFVVGGYPQSERQYVKLGEAYVIFGKHTATADGDLAAVLRIVVARRHKRLHHTWRRRIW